MPSYVLLGLMGVFLFVAIAAWVRIRTQTMETSTNGLLFAVVITLFALLFKLVSTGMDVVVLVIGLAGWASAGTGISSEP